MPVKSARWALLCTLLCVGGVTAASAQQSPRIPVGNAKLFRVDEGVFEIELGKPIDLTNRRILLWIGPDRDQLFNLTLNGQRISPWQIGSRLNLKDINSTKQHVADRDQCYLDIIEVVNPKGGKGTATFRLHCI